MFIIHISESVLAAAREEGVPVSSLRLVGNPAPTQLPKEAPPPVPGMSCYFFVSLSVCMTL